MNLSKINILTIISIVVILPLGFLTKFYSGPAGEWVNNSLGGVFYEIFWCLVVLLFFPKLKSLKIAISVFIITCCLEILQLWHPWFLEVIRSNFIGVTIFGNSFNWFDFPYYFIGSLLGYLWLYKIKKTLTI